MAMDAITNGTYVQNEAWLKLNLAGKGDVELSFWWKEFSDETHTQDGVYFSDNGGSSFVKVYDLINGTTTYQEIVLDLDALASSNGLSLTGTFVVKFQQYDNYGLTTDGMTFDDISVTSLEAPPVADFEGIPTSGTAPLTVNFTDLSSGNPTSWSWTFGDGGTSSAQNPSYEYTSAGTYTVSLTATNAYGNDTETKVDYITVTEPGTGNWVVITYDDFEAGLGNYTDGGGDCQRYGGSYSWQGTYSMEIRDNSGVASSFYHTSSYNVTGYSELEIDFYFYARSMDNTNEDFWLQYYDGSSWLTVATWAQGIDFDNDVFYHTTVTLTDAQFNFPTNAKLRFMCDASGNYDWVYIDAITFSGWDPTARLRADNTVLPDQFSLSQNYPNPFNPITNINYSLPTACEVELEIFNIMGQRVTTLVNDFKEAGNHTIMWDGTNEEGTQVASAVYFYRIQAGDFKATKKMVLMK
jgi:PKD repeat protein